MIALNILRIQLSHFSPPQWLLIEYNANIATVRSTFWQNNPFPSKISQQKKKRSAGGVHTLNTFFFQNKDTKQLRCSYKTPLVGCDTSHCVLAPRLSFHFIQFIPVWDQQTYTHKWEVPFIQFYFFIYCFFCCIAAASCRGADTPFVLCPWGMNYDISRSRKE